MNKKLLIGTCLIFLTISMATANEIRKEYNEYLSSPIQVETAPILDAPIATTVTSGSKTGVLLGDLKATDTGQIIVGEIDWDSLESSKFAYASATTITVEGLDATEIFQIGDKLRIKQTTYKYFYVVGVITTTLTLYAGDDYSVASANIEEISFSRNVSPSGFPTTFSFSSTLAAYDQAFTVSAQGTFGGTMWMTGKIITAVYTRTDFQLSGFGDYFVHEELPIDRSTNTKIYIAGIGSSATDLPYAIGISSPPLSASASATGDVEISRLPYAVYRLSENISHWFTIVYEVG